MYQPVIIPRNQHTISRKEMSKNALFVLYQLKKVGFQGYLVGGGVRDIFLGRVPKDFDVVTDARPEEIRALFRSCRLIGRRFRLAHVHFPEEIIEVATFRALPRGMDEDDFEDEELPRSDSRSLQEEALIVGENGRILQDNVYGTIEEDAWRRDFSINALYYNIKDFSIIDYVGGLSDLTSGVIRLIGQDPWQRCREDPVRMLRAIRFSAKLSFRIHHETEAAIYQLGNLLIHIPPARLFDEVVKLFQGGCAVETFHRLRAYGLFAHLFPYTEEVLQKEGENAAHLNFLLIALTNTDTRVSENKPVTPAFLIASLLWPHLRHTAETLKQGNTMGEVEAYNWAMGEVLRHQIARTALPKRFTIQVKEIWMLQPLFFKRNGKQPIRLLQNPRFRAAYDFLLVRHQVGEIDDEIAQWWTEFQTLSPADQKQFIEQVHKRIKRRKKRKRKKTKSQESALTLTQETE